MLYSSIERVSKWQNVACFVKSCLTQSKWFACITLNWNVINFHLRWQRRNSRFHFDYLCLFVEFLVHIRLFSELNEDIRENIDVALASVVIHTFVFFQTVLTFHSTLIWILFLIGFSVILIENDSKRSKMKDVSSISNTFLQLVIGTRTDTLLKR